MTCSRRGIALLCCFFVLGVFLTAAGAEEIKVGAGAAPTENVFNKIMDPMEKAIGLKVILVSNGPVDAFKQLDQGSVDAATGGLSFPDWIALMEKEGYAIPDKTAYKHRVIGKDIIKVIMHQDVTVKQLSKDQLKAIFTGKAANWKDVGGPDLPIVIIYGNKIPGTQNVFQKQAMDGELYTKNVQESGTAAEVKAKVAATPGGIGLAPASLLDASIAAPDIPEVGRPITIITKGEPSPAAVKMLDFIRGDGQKYLK